jgi:hypothetical protein
MKVLSGFTFDDCFILLSQFTKEWELKSSEVKFILHRSGSEVGMTIPLVIPGSGETLPSGQAGRESTLIPDKLE